MSLRVAIALACISVPGIASAGTYEIHSGDDLFTRLKTLVAGDQVIVHAGTYTTGGLLQVTWAGTPTGVISVRAADGERPVIQGNASQNVIDLSGTYFEFKGFEIRGGSHGIRLGATQHALLEDLVLHDLGDVGISCNRPGQDCFQITIRHNEIYATGTAGTGEGMYLGGNDATNIFRDSLIERNYLHDLGGDQGDGIEVKTGAYGVIVRDNVIVRSKYPAITMYGYAGNGMPNIVERNLVWTTVDNGIQIVGQVVVRNNVILGAGANGIQSKASQGQTPHDLVIEHNTVISSGGPCLKANDWTAAPNQLVANNAFYCAGGTAIDLNGGAPGAMLFGNAGLGTSNAAGGFRQGGTLAADLGASPNVYPPAGSSLVNAGDAAHTVLEDFNGTPRADGMPDVGAYERTTDTNPGWMPVEGFKTETPVNGADNTNPGGFDGHDVVGGNDNSGCCGAGTGRSSALLGGLVVLALRRRRVRA